MATTFASSGAAVVVANVERKRQAKFVRSDWPRDADLTCRIRVPKTSRICLYNGRLLKANDRDATIL